MTHTRTHCICDDNCATMMTATHTHARTRKPVACLPKSCSAYVARMSMRRRRRRHQFTWPAHLSNFKVLMAHSNTHTRDIIYESNKCRAQPMLIWSVARIQVVVVDKHSNHRKYDDASKVCTIALLSRNPILALSPLPFCTREKRQQHRKQQRQQQHRCNLRSHAHKTLITNRTLRERTCAIQPI